MHVAPVSTILQFYLASLQMFLKDIIITRSRKKGFMWDDNLIYELYLYISDSAQHTWSFSFTVLQLSLQKFNSYRNITRRFDVVFLSARETMGNLRDGMKYTVVSFSLYVRFWAYIGICQSKMSRKKSSRWSINRCYDKSGWIHWTVWCILYMIYWWTSSNI